MGATFRRRVALLLPLMTAINSCAVGIGPRQPLIAWVRQVSGDQDVRWGANEDGLYLLPVYQDDLERASPPIRPP